VTVFAAASLIEPLREIAADYEKQSGDKVVFNFAASGMLARQIEEGAPADIFFSADEPKLDGLAQKGLLVNETRRNRLANSLVLVAGMDAPTMHSPAELTNAAIKRIGLGDTKTVPAGTYAKAYLEKAGVWAAIERKVIPCENVRAVLAAVESGNVDVGIVYKTDAAISRKAKVAYEVPENEGPKIIYPLAQVKGGPSPDAAKKFLAYLESGNADNVFTRHGFGILPVSGR
jgi:molybdate transport system substrate-binding protein